MVVHLPENLVYYIDSLKIHVKDWFFFIELIYIVYNQLIVVKNDSTHTIGAEFGSKVLMVGPKNVKLQIWDVCLIKFFSILSMI